MTGDKKLYMFKLKLHHLRIKITALIISVLLLLLSSCATGESKGAFPDYSDIPEWRGTPTVEINGGEPFFDSDDKVEKSYESYSPLDQLGRCGAAIACIGTDIMPDHERGDISSVTPTGFYHNGKSNNNSYDFIEYGYVYNRCHLLGFQLTGDDANDRNLITGTRYLNIEGMLPYENQVANYVKLTGNHVLMRVTPIYKDYDYVARGVLMEACSVEDGGRGLKFCVFAYNIQPDVIIDYFTGENRVDPFGAHTMDSFTSSDTYVLNTKSKKYHVPECHYANIADPQFLERYKGSVAAFPIVHPDYSPCGVCKPHKK